jgi:glycosyltransferase involved in cell wall biosynthesis/SAM-dependent methyltransferase
MLEALSPSRGPGLKLIIQIPCFNEAQTLAVTLAALPRTVAGFDCVEWLVIDDGSDDDTAAVAKANGADHLIRHAGNKGLAKAFMTGLDECLRLGADVVVNTDADNQYKAADIPALTVPILAQRAELVVGARPIAAIAHFSPVKKLLQSLGSWAVRVASKTDVQDATSGFRAISRACAQRLMVFNDYTYTLETLIQAGQLGMAVVSVPIRVNPDLRPSKLVKSIPFYIQRSMFTIVRIFVIYRPFFFFGAIGATLIGAGLLAGLRFLAAWLGGPGEARVQTLILAAVLLGMGFQALLIAFIADLLSANRQLLEDIRFKNARLAERAGAGMAQAIAADAFVPSPIVSCPIVASPAVAGAHSAPLEIAGGATEDGVVIGNVYDKYGSRNPVVNRLMRGFESALSEFVAASAPQSIHEIGCGEGHWVVRWNETGLCARGCDFSRKIIDMARANAGRRGLPASLFEARSIYDLDPRHDGADLVVCCEVLEHLQHPARALEALGRVVGRHLIVSVPREPVWRALNLARGKYLRRLGNTPGHIQHWSSAGFINLVSEYFDVVAVRNPLPWTMLLCRPRTR